MSLKLNDEQASKLFQGPHEPWLAVNNTYYVTKKTNSGVTEFQPQIKTLLIDSMPSLLMVFLSIPFNELPGSSINAIPSALEMLSSRSTTPKRITSPRKQNQK